MLLGEVHALNQYAAIIKYLQYSAVSALVFAGSYYDFVAFSNLVHFSIPKVGAAHGRDRAHGALLQNLGCQ
jgi:DUF1009 family protein